MFLTKWFLSVVFVAAIPAGDAAINCPNQCSTAFCAGASNLCQPNKHTPRLYSTRDSIGGLSVIVHRWPRYSDSYTFPTIISVDGGFGANFFWAHQFFLQNGDGGYFGLQNRGDYKVRAINFSIWQATGWINGLKSNCRFFSHEGSGVQCDVIYNWDLDTKYHLQITKMGNQVSAYFIQPSSGQHMLVATIIIPKKWGNFINSITFTEEYTLDLTDCERLQRSSVTLLQPFNEFNEQAQLSTYIYGICGQKSYVTSVCNAFQCLVDTHNNYKYV